MRATAPGWLSTEIVNCLVLAMPHLLVAAIIRLLRRGGCASPKFADLSSGHAGKEEFQPWRWLLRPRQWRYTRHSLPGVLEWQENKRGESPGSRSRRSARSWASPYRPRR